MLLIIITVFLLILIILCLFDLGGRNYSFSDLGFTKPSRYVYWALIFAVLQLFLLLVFWFFFDVEDVYFKEYDFMEIKRFLEIPWMADYAWEICCYFFATAFTGFQYICVTTIKGFFLICETTLRGFQYIYITTVNGFFYIWETTHRGFQYICITTINGFFYICETTFRGFQYLFGISLNGFYSWYFGFKYWLLDLTENGLVSQIPFVGDFVNYFIVYSFYCEIFCYTFYLLILKLWYTIVLFYMNEILVYYEFFYAWIIKIWSIINVFFMGIIFFYQDFCQDFCHNIIIFIFGWLDIFVYYSTDSTLALMNFLGIAVMVDGLSLSFILLSSFVFLLCLLALVDWINITYCQNMLFKQYLLVEQDKAESLGVDNFKKGYTGKNQEEIYITQDQGFSMKFFILLLFSIHFLLLICFTSTHIFQFYIAFELLLLPMIYLIALWGSQARRSLAIMYFFMYTLFGSLLMLVGIIILMYDTGTTDMLYLLFIDFSLEKQKILWLLFFFGFAIKIPMFPFHIWLPEAHVEAPTIGSVILAALLLKLGSYGMIRILLGILPDASRFFSPLVLTLATLGIVYSSIILLSQIDMKRIIAYSSIAHMNFGVLGLFSGNIEGITGGIFLMLAHGISSSALFFLVGMLYDRYHTRELLNYGGLTLLMPVMSFFFFLFSIANFGFPGTFNFVGEFLVFVGVLISTTKMGLFAGLGIFFSVIYSMLLYNRIFFGELRHTELVSSYYVDITFCEFIVLFMLGIVLLIYGINATSILDLLSYPISFLLLN